MAVATPGEVQRVTPEEAKAAFDSGSAVFLDVRSHTAYVQSHIPGALSIPLAEFSRVSLNWTQDSGSSPTAPDRKKSQASVRRKSCSKMVLRVPTRSWVVLAPGSMPVIPLKPVHKNGIFVWLIL